MPAAELEGVQEDVKIWFPGEDGQPIDHGAGDEVGEVRLSDGVAASHGPGASRGRSWSFAGKWRSQAGAWERGGFRQLLCYLFQINSIKKLFCFLQNIIQVCSVNN